jgi:hypothetical protein
MLGFGPFSIPSPFDGVNRGPSERSLNLLVILVLHRARGRLRFHGGSLFKERMTMNTALVSSKRNGDENKHYDENDSLFVFGQLENSEQALHFLA